MALILNLETATKSCSVCLAKDGQILVTKEASSENYSHAEQLNLFIEEVLSKTSIKLTDVDAVAISAGPGSYTGLRIGTSTAKGICYALNKPLIAVNSLKALASLANVENALVIPMFDARRMEVYSAIYNERLVEIEPTEAVVIDESSYLNHLERGMVYFIGPGASKCAGVIQHPHAKFDLNIEVSAKGMVALTEEKYNNADFVDVAYFEPAYLKDFIAGLPKRLI
ncbi:MAG: tRNA (adenosine(37)-N6)-threonylcarbamoyltransferase complex dimerization subunit type 1 TsaB [Crocinitomicaceae bacterium]